MKAFRLGLLVLVCVSGWVRAAETPAATIESQSVIDRIKVKFWSNYSGPQLAAPTSRSTTDHFGNKTDQNADDLLTAGYQITPGLRLGVGFPFNFLPLGSDVLQLKPIYVGVLDAKLYESGPFSVHADFRFYTPIGEVARAQDVLSGFRTTQVSLYKATSNLTLGAVTYFRVWAYGANGSGFRKDLEIYFSPFANYRLTQTLYATLWTDVLQLGNQHGKPGSFSNLPIDVQPGIRWDITPAFSVNPYLNITPAKLRADNINVGLVVNATLL